MASPVLDVIGKYTQIRQIVVEVDLAFCSDIWVHFAFGEMETDVHANSALQYDPYVCVDNKVEKLSSGALDHLLPFVPALKELYNKGSNCNFTLQLPENMHGSDWFTESTFERFLCIVNSPDLVAKTKLINQEMAQLEEGRKFQLSLFSETGADIPSSDATRNDLLRAMDSRLAALTGDLAASFAQIASAICSAKELIAIADFTQLFGAKDLAIALHRILETSQGSQIADSRSGNRNSVKLDAKNGNTIGMEIAVVHSRPDQVEAHVKYSVSPAKVAEVERQSSTGSEEEPSYSDCEGCQTSVERSRTLTRSAMRRVQIGRSRSRRTAALNIKSINYFPVRSAVTQAETCENDNEKDQGSDQTNKKVENEIRKTSVQDKIRIFESKKKHQAADIEKRWSSVNFSVGASKSVLRRWSSGVGETSSRDEAEAVVEVSDTVNLREVNTEELKESTPEIVEVQIESRNSHSVEANEDVKLRENEDSGPESISSLLYKEPTEVTVSDRLASSVEWNRQKETELNQMMMEMMETKNVRVKPGLSRSQDIPVEHRGGFSDKYKQSRVERFQGKNARKQAEKKAQFKAMEEVLNERRAEMGTPNVKDGKKGVAKKPQKSLANSLQAARSKKENHIPPTAKKASARTASLPVVRKSWPLTPASRTAVVSPAKASGTPSPTGVTPSCRKPQLTSSVSASIRPKHKTEQSLAKQKVVKEEKPQPVPKTGRTDKAKVSRGSAQNNGSEVVQAKPSFYNKVTKKSSVVPLELKRTRRSPGSAPLIKKETKESETYTNDCQDSKEEHCSEQNIADPDLVSLQETADSSSTGPLGTTYLEPEVLEINPPECDKEESFGERFDASRSALGHTMDPVSEQAGEEINISPMAWVEIEERADIPPLHDDCMFEFGSRANVASGGSSSARVRRSLSQMLQEDNSDEPDLSEWGNAENPPSLIYQRDAAPKGLKKLLKFGRKSKGDANLSGWSSPSVFSEGEDDVNDPKILIKRSSENLLKEVLQSKNFGPHESMSGFAKFQHRISSSTAPTAKATRTFFFLSAFRGSNKPGDANHR